MLFFNDPSPKFRESFSNAGSAIKTFIDSKQFIKGSEVNALENKLTKFLDVDSFFGCANGTDAITISLLASGLEKGSKIAIPAITAPATSVAVIRAGMVPVIVDVDKFALICFKSLESALSKSEIKGIIFVHLYGNVCDLNKINEYKERGYITIEDCAQSFGSSMGKVYTGSVGDFGTHSFYPTKNLSCPGDGGGISVKDCSEKLDERLRMISEYGWNKERKVLEEGLNSRLDELHAVFLLKSLNNFNQELKDKRDLLHIIGEAFIDKKEAEFLSHFSFDEINVSPHLAVINCKNPEQIEAIANKHKISLGRHYEVPLPYHPYFSNFETFSINENPNWNDISQNTRSLPFFWGMTQSQKNQLMELIDEIL